MRGSTFRQRATAWIATLAILLAALVPAISQAAYHASGDDLWLEVCTAYGIQRVAVDADAQSSEDTARLIIEHCSYCGLHSDPAVLPSPSTALPVAVAGGATATVRILHFPRPPLTWAASRPRAPPGLL